MDKITDKNGYKTYKNVAISKIGVYPYSGRQLPDADPNKIYMVYTPESALNNPKTIASANNVPIIEDHTMLGKAFDHNNSKADGVTSGNTYYKRPHLYNDFKIFNQQLIDTVDVKGKKQVSMGYTLKYRKEQGTYNGQSYDYIQDDIEFNHGAIVHAGRKGNSVSLDAISNDVIYSDVYTIEDNTEMKTDDVKKDVDKQISLDNVNDNLNNLTETVNKLSETMVGLNEQLHKIKEEAQNTTNVKQEKTEEEIVSEDEMDIAIDQEEIRGQIEKDALESFKVGQELKNKLGSFIPNFAEDSSDANTQEEVSKKACEVLELACDSDHLTFINGYIAGRSQVKEIKQSKIVNKSTGMDAKTKTDLSKFI